MAIFGRKSARQRLRRATEGSLEFSAFSSPVDCTPWVVGGLWPAELAVVTAQTATLAKLLTADLQRISASANDEMKMVRRAGLTDSARQAAEARVINEARARAEQRVESTVRQLHKVPAGAPAEQPRGGFAEDVAERDFEKTIVIPRVDIPPAPAARRAQAPPVDGVRTRRRADDKLEGRRRAAVPVARPEPAAERPGRPPEPEVPPPAAPVAGAEPAEERPQRPAEPEVPPAAPVAEAESADERLQRLLAFVARQEPRLNWAVGDHHDGTTVLVTDLAHGWIPSGIALPAGVRLLLPDRRTGRAAATVGDAARAATYRPGDPFGWLVEFAPTEASVQPRELPEVDDLGWELGAATHWRDGLPRMVHTLAKAAAAGTGVVEEEVDLLRVHLDTARYRLLEQYPEADPLLLLNCMLLAATDSLVAGDPVSANYHLSWFQKLNAPPASRWAENPVWGEG